MHPTPVTVAWTARPRGVARRWIAPTVLFLLLGSAPGFLASACGARSELAAGASRSSGRTSAAGTGGTAGVGGAGGSCAAEPCMPGPAPGDARWSRLYSGDQAAGFSLAVDGAGDVVVAGSLRGSVDFGCGPISVEAGTGSFVAKLDPCHACVWSQAFEGLGVAGIAVSASGGVVMAGTLDVPFPGASARVTALDASGASGTFDGSLDLGGGPLQPAGWEDTFVVALGPGGAYVWAKSFPGFGVSGLAVGGGDDLFLMGMTVGTANFGGGSLGAQGTSIALASLGATGSYRWAHAFPIPAGGATGAVAVDGSARVIITGGIGGGSPDFGCGPLAGAGVLLAAFAQ